MHALPESNFSFLHGHDEKLLRLGLLAERYFTDDPNTSLLKLRQLTELLAQLAASHVGLFESPDEPQFDLLRRLKENGILPPEIAQLFNDVRRAGNLANHALSGDHYAALRALRFSWQLALWFHRTFGNHSFKSSPFIPPAPPRDQSTELSGELERLRRELDAHRAVNSETIQRLESTEAELRAARDEQMFWEELAVETEQAKRELEARLTTQQSATLGHQKELLAKYSVSASTAATAVQLDEADTRKLIDEQLRQAGWEVDTPTLAYARGTRPLKGKNMAIAEWPTANGPADYVLFIGLIPVAVIEAKRKNLNVSASLQQAKRYSRGFELSMIMASPGGPWDTFHIPFAFASNGRPFLRQLSTQSGIWFCDLRRPDNHGRALDGWYTPEGLAALLKRDEEKAERQLATESFNYGVQLRHYQQSAIRMVEQGIAEGRRAMLLAMATGTGKTKTCIALVYRLLKTQRFRRVLFLVDRSALGVQAADAFKDTRMENLQTFADIFGIKELDEQTPDTETAVHLATVQGMVKRVLYPGENDYPPAVDQYDCIIVDECHRGYLLDRELSETELTFRSYDDYISKYRRVLDYFDAVKIGLTATPALHTTEIFGLPVYNYSYREAVIDGYLVDHEPPIQIKTKLSEDGISWKVGDEVKVYDPTRSQVDLYTAPDEINMNVEEFNRKVITREFNRVVCEYLASEIDPTSRRKTLIFCVDNGHADLVVELLKEAFQQQYGSVDDDAVIKITGAADKPLQLIRRFRNERDPNVAVTVDLLTTGIDVPEICNLVFIRRVNSRILFDQMLGRATRLCDAIDKETFRIFDAVRIYNVLQKLTAMQPVVVNSKITFAQLAKELATVSDDTARALVRDQFIAKLQRKKKHLSETGAHDFEARIGMTPDVFIKKVRTMPLSEVAALFAKHPDLGDILDRKGDTPGRPMLISEHPDELRAIEHGYGTATKPEDYLKEFAAFIQSNSNTIPALITVLTRPRELTRKQLRELALELSKADFTEANLATAWREMTNQDIAARIVGYIRQAAIGDALIPYELRVDSALQRMLASRPWSTIQRDWLRRIAAQTKANTVVDREAIDDPDLLFRREGGGFKRLNLIFEGQLQQVLEEFNESLWQQAA